jgi:hypothetical protein
MDTFSRAYLQGLGNKEEEVLFQELIDQRIEDIVHYIIENVMKSAKTGKTSFCFGVNHARSSNLCPIVYFEGKKSHLSASNLKTKNTIQDVKQKLHQIFPDSTIFLDTLDRYLLVDWS